MKKIIIIALLMKGLSGFYSFSQETGKKDFPDLGISFIIPDGFFGQIADEGYLIASENFKGFVFLDIHEQNEIEELKKEAKKGLDDGLNTRLSLTGTLENLSSEMIGGVYTGTLAGENAMAYIIGIINTKGPYGVIILAAASKDDYSEEVKNLALSIASSIVFSKMEAPAPSNEWEQILTNSRLTWLSSYSGGTSGGSSARTVIDLCSGNRFSYSSSSSTSIDVGGVWGSSSGSDNGEGTWTVLINSSGNPVLTLSFSDGRKWEYLLEYRDQKYYLNGNRYFRTTSDDAYGNGPVCL